MNKVADSAVARQASSSKRDDVAVGFEAVTKREAVRLAWKMVITKDELTQLIFNSHSHLGYRHRLRFREFHPPQHKTYSDDISDAIGKARPGPAAPEMVKAMRKMHAI